MSEHLHFEVSGDCSNPAMLMVHGFLSSNLQWLPNRDVLSEHFRLVMVETWGHGQSPAPDNATFYAANFYCKELERIRISLGIDKWITVGHSFGAGIVISYALQYPQHVHGIIFTNSRSAIGIIGPSSRHIPTEKFRNGRWLPMHPINARRLPADLKNRLVEAADQVDPLAASLGAKMSYTMACRERLHLLNAPTLLVNGVHEEAFQSDVEFARSALAELEIVNLEAGHSTNLEAPEAFNHAVLEFCSRIPGL